MKNNQRGFIIPLTIIFIAFLAVGGGVYVYKNLNHVPEASSSKFSPIADDSVNQKISSSPSILNTRFKNQISATTSQSNEWKLYTNTKWGVSFQYPISWGLPKVLSDSSVSFNDILIISSYSAARTPSIIPTSSLTIGGFNAKVATSSQLGTLIQIAVDNNTTIEIEYGNSNLKDTTFAHILSTLSIATTRNDMRE